MVSGFFTNMLLVMLLLVSCVFAQDFNIIMPASVPAGNAIQLTWSVPTSLPVSILLKQGTPGTVGQSIVVQVLADSIPSSGSYTWAIDNNTPSGNNYFLRIQTGAASDWNGGLGGAESRPSPDALFGISNIFAIDSSVPSTSYTNPTTSLAPSMLSSATSSASVPPSTFSSTVSSHTISSSTSATPTSTSKSSGPKIAVIVGPVVGGVAGIALLAGLIAALMHAANSKPPAPGASASKNHEFIFLPPLPKDGKLDPTQITLTLTPKERPGDRTYQTVAWQVFTVDKNDDSFQASLPYDLGFGSVKMTEDNDVIAQISTVTSSFFEFAPPGWLLSMKHSGDNIFFEKADKRSREAKNRILVKNECMGSRHIAIGSYHKGKDMEDLPGLQPFLVVDNVPHDTEFSAQHALILHAYQTRDIDVGQVMTESIISKSRPLFGPEGEEVTLLPRTSTWRVQPDGTEKVKLVFEKQKKEKGRFC